MKQKTSRNKIDLIHLENTVAWGNNTFIQKQQVLTKFFLLDPCRAEQKYILSMISGWSLASLSVWEAFSSGLSLWCWFRSLEQRSCCLSRFFSSLMGLMAKSQKDWNQVLKALFHSASWTQSAVRVPRAPSTFSLWHSTKPNNVGP